MMTSYQRFPDWLSLSFEFSRSSKAKSRIFNKCHSVAIIVISISDNKLINAVHDVMMSVVLQFKVLLSAFVSALQTLGFSAVAGPLM